MTAPHTPQLKQTRWSTQTAESDAPAYYLSSPSSPETPITPLSPTQNMWYSLDNHVTVVDADSPKTLLKDRQSLSRQSSIKRQPVKIGELTLGAFIGSGSFSRTYQAYGPTGVYAVKMKLPSTNQELFENESRVLKKLGAHPEQSHASVTYFYPDLSESDKLVFELYETNLESLVTSPQFQPDENDFDFFDFRNASKPLVGLDLWTNWSHQLSEAMNYIHSQNIVHADFKPDNVLVKNNKLVIADFSGSIDTDTELSSTLGHELVEGIAWSPVYTDPEVRHGNAAPSAGSDIYSLGLVLAFCATGEEPYSTARNSTQRLMWMEKVQPLESFDAGKQSRLNMVRPVIEKCLTRSLNGIDAIIDAIPQS